MSASSPSPARITWHTHYALAVLAMIYVFNYIDRLVISILIEPIKAEFGVSDTQIGLLSGLAFALFYTVFGSDSERKDTADVLEENRGRIRSAVGKGLGIRLTPSLEFIADGVPENAAVIDSLLREATERDSEARALAAAAEYAGDEDPYIKPRDLDDDD